MKRIKAVADLNIYLQRNFQLIFEKQGLMVQIGSMNLAKLVIEMTGSEAKIVYSPLPEDDPVRRQPDISRARDMLAWQPTTSLEVGLKKVIEYFRNGMQ